MSDDEDASARRCVITVPDSRSSFRLALLPTADLHIRRDICPISARRFASGSPFSGFRLFSRFHSIHNSRPDEDLTTASTAVTRSFSWPQPDSEPCPHRLCLLRIDPGSRFRAAVLPENEFSRESIPRGSGSPGFNLKLTRLLMELIADPGPRGSDAGLRRRSAGAAVAFQLRPINFLGETKRLPRFHQVHVPVSL